MTSRVSKACRVAGIVVVSSLAACHFPREPVTFRDAAPDAISTPDGDDAPSVDVPSVLDVPPPTDVRDAANESSIDASTCPVLDPETDGFRVGGSSVVASSTVGQRSVLTPPRLGTGCAMDFSTSPSPERVVRYTMRDGTRLYATTDAPNCEGVFDTIVYIRTSCEPDMSMALACNDDDQVLSGCTTGCTGTDCPRYASSAAAEGLRVGQTVYVVVDGYMGHAGRFRVVLTENGLQNATPPGTGSGLVTADRCACPDTRDNMQSAAIAFPSAGDIVVGAGGRLTAAGDSITGTRTLAFSRVGGATLQFQLNANGLMASAACMNTRATMDLLVADTVVQSFEIQTSTPVHVPVRVAFQTFGSLTVNNALPVPLALRLRGITPAGCGSIDIERAPPGELRLLGR